MSSRIRAARVDAPIERTLLAAPMLVKGKSTRGPNACPDQRAGTGIAGKRPNSEARERTGSRTTADALRGRTDRSRFVAGSKANSEQSNEKNLKAHEVVLSSQRLPLRRTGAAQG